MVTAAMAAALAAMAVSGSAHAQALNACGPIDAEGRASCGADVNTYRDGIAYTAADPVDLTVVLESDAGVTRGAGDGGGASVNLSVTGASSVTLDAVEGSYITTYADDQSGVLVVSDTGNITVTAPRTWTSGANAGGLVATSTGGGDVIVDAPAEITTYGSRSTGVRVNTSGRAQATVGDVFTHGYQSDAVIVTGSEVDVTVTGAVSTEDIQSYGVYARASTGAATVTIDGSVKTDGGRSFGAFVRAQTGVTLSGSGSVESNGTFSNGVDVETTSGDVVIDLATLRVSGREQTALRATAHDGDVEIQVGDFVMDAIRSGGVMGFSNGRTVISVDSIAITGLGGTGGISGVGDDVELTIGDLTHQGVDADSIETFARNSAIVTVNGDIYSEVRSNSIDNVVTAYAADGSVYPDNPDATVLVTLNGTITTVGERLTAIRGDTSGRLTITGPGSISTRNYSALGIKAYSGGDQVVEIGSIDTQGYAAQAVKVNTGGHSRVSIDEISTSGNQGVGVWVVRSQSADVFVEEMSTSGTFAHGVYATSSGHVNVGAGLLTTEGLRASGITVLESASAAVTVGELRTSGGSADALWVASDGDVQVDLETLVTEGLSSRGLLLRNDGDTAVRIGSGETLDSVSGLVDIESGGNIALELGSAVTRGSLSTAASLSGADIVVAAQDISTAGNRSHALLLTASGDLLASAEGPISTAGNLAMGAWIRAGGSATLIAGDVSTEGARSVGVLATGNEVGVLAQTVQTAGLRADGVYAQAQSDITVAAGDVATTGDYSQGIFAQSTEGEITITAGSVSTQGASARAIAATGGGPVTVVLGSGSVSGDLSSVVSVSAAGDVDVTVGDLDVSGAGSRGVVVETLARASVTVEGLVTGSVDHPEPPPPPAGPNGRTRDPAQAIIDVSAEDLVRVIHEGAIITTGTREGGIAARGQQGAMVTGSGTVRTAGEGATGLYVGAYSGIAFADVIEGEVTTDGDHAHGVHVRSYGAAGAHVGGAYTSGERAIGILVEGAGQAIVAASSVYTTGQEAHGIVGHSYGAAQVRAGSVIVTGPGAIGIDAASYGPGDAYGAATAVRVSDGRGISVFAIDGSASAMVTEMTHASAHGESAISARGAAGAIVSFEDVTSRSDAIGAAVIAVSRDGDVSVEGASLVTEGVDRDGVVALSDGGAVTVDIASIVTEGRAVRAESYGDIDVTLGAVRSSATGRAAIDATGSNVVVRAGSVEMTGDGDAQADSAAINAVATDGGVTLQVGSLSAVGARRFGIAAQGLTVDLTVTGAVLATEDAIVIRANDGASLTNSGEIASQVGAALRAFGGPLSLNNDGRIEGALILGDGGNTLTNAGTLHFTGASLLGAGDDRLVNDGDVVLAGSLDMGGGTDRFVNNGALLFTPWDEGLTTMRVTSASVLAAPMGVSRTIAGLETFENNGFIDLRNDAVGDVLTLSGAFVGGEGSGVAVDLAFDGSGSDALVIAGPATGSTNIVINPVGEPVLLTIATPIVTAGAGSSPTAFSIEPDNSASLFAYGVAFDAATGVFSAVAAPSVGAYRLMKVAEGAQSLWHDSADSVTAHLASARNGAGTARGAWASASIGHVRRLDGRTFTNLGATQVADLGYQQEVTSGQFGIDLGAGGMTWGLTAGFADAVMDFVGSGDEARNEAINVGGYVAYARGRFYGTALAKYDWYDIDATLVSSATQASTDASGAGLALQAGARFGGEAFRIEPIAGVSWSRISLDRLDLPLQVDFDARSGGRANAGVRLSALRDLDQGGTVSLSFQLDYVQPFGGEAGTRFSAGGGSVLIDDERIGSHGRGAFGAAFTQGRITAFFEAEARVSDDYKGGLGRVGVRIGL